MSRATVEISPGMRILTNRRVAIVVEIDRHGAHLKDSTGHTYFTAYTELDARKVSDSGVQVLHSSPFPWFIQLPADVQATALFRQQCVMERSAWRLLIVTTCSRHQSPLVARCPSCRRPFRDQRHSHLRRVGAATVCGNPLGAGPAKQCQHDLTTIEATSAPDDVIAVQTRVDTALAGHTVTVLGQAAKPAAYLTDLRHLTTLLFHLAGQPGAARLAPWVTDLAGETEGRSGDR